MGGSFPADSSTETIVVTSAAGAVPSEMRSVIGKSPVPEKSGTGPSVPFSASKGSAFPSTVPRHLFVSESPFGSVPAPVKV
jgi:hypothetical protein